MPAADSIEGWLLDWAGDNVDEIEATWAVIDEGKRLIAADLGRHHRFELNEFRGDGNGGLPRKPKKGKGSFMRIKYDNFNISDEDYHPYLDSYTLDITRGQLDFISEALELFPNFVECDLSFTLTTEDRRTLDMMLAYPEYGNEVPLGHNTTLGEYLVADLEDSIKQAIDWQYECDHQDDWAQYESEFDDAWEAHSVYRRMVYLPETDKTIVITREYVDHEIDFYLSENERALKHEVAMDLYGWNPDDLESEVNYAWKLQADWQAGMEEFKYEDMENHYFGPYHDEIRFGVEFTEQLKQDNFYENGDYDSYSDFFDAEVHPSWEMEQEWEDERNVLTEILIDCVNCGWFDYIPSLTGDGIRARIYDGFENCDAIGCLGSWLGIYGNYEAASHALYCLPWHDAPSILEQVIAAVDLEVADDNETSLESDWNRWVARRI